MRSRSCSAQASGGVAALVNEAVVFGDGGVTEVVVVEVVEVVGRRRRRVGTAKRVTKGFEIRKQELFESHCKGTHQIGRASCRERV